MELYTYYLRFLSFITMMKSPPFGFRASSSQKTTSNSSPPPNKTLCVANVFKYDKSDKIGLTVKYSNTLERVYISEVRPNGKFARTSLQTGMVILTINGKPCPRTVKETTEIIRDIEGDLTIVAVSLKNNQQHFVQPRTQQTTRLPMHDNNNANNDNNNEDRRKRLSHTLGPAATFATESSSAAAAAIIQPSDSEVETTLLEFRQDDDEEEEEEKEAFSLQEGLSFASLQEGLSFATDEEHDENITAITNEFRVKTMTSQVNGTTNVVTPPPPEPTTPSIFPSLDSFTATARTYLFSSSSSGSTTPAAAAAATVEDEEKKEEEQFHQYPPPPPKNAKEAIEERAAAVPPSLQQPGFYMESPGAYSIPGPTALTRSSSRASSISRATSYGTSAMSDDSSFLRSFYDSGDFSDFDDEDTIATESNHDSSNHGGITYEDGILDMILNDDNATTNEESTLGEEDRKPPASRNGLVVAAELTDDAEAEMEEQVRKRILRETAKASVVMVEHGGPLNAKMSPSQQERRGSSKYSSRRKKHKNVKEKFFGDGKKNSIEVILSGLENSTDDYIQKRTLLPWTVKKNNTTNLWVASVQTDQKAWEANGESSHTLSLEQVRSMHTFSGATEQEAYEAGLAMAPPVMQSFEDNPICYMCKSQFAVFQRPKHCRNCGVVICSTCCCSWSSKRVPETYRTKRNSNTGTVIVCLGCDWLATNFQQALMRGNISKAVSLYKTGNINLRTPYGPYHGGRNIKRQGEIMYPMHMAIIGGNVALVQWLASDRFVPLKRSLPPGASASGSNGTNSTRRGSGSRHSKKSNSNNKLAFRGENNDDLVLRTSKGRSPIRLALGLEHSDILKFLVSNNGLSLLDEDLRTDYRKVLRHLKVLLEIVPASLLAQQNHLPASVQVVGSSSTEFDEKHKENDDLPPPGSHLMA